MEDELEIEVVKRKKKWQERLKKPEEQGDTFRERRV